MYIKRKLESTILRYLKAPEILAIVGPRQSGKTTMLKKIQKTLPDSIFLTFEDMGDLSLFERDIKAFAKQYFANKYIFIDEFQHAKQGGKSLKYLYDTHPNNKIIISGSSAIDLTIKAIKLLVGRVFIFNLFELDFEEYLSFRDPSLSQIYLESRKNINLKKPILRDLKINDIHNRQFLNIADEFIIWGGYPRAALASTNEDKMLVLKNIYNTYFLRDIKDTFGLIDSYKLAKLIEALATQIGQLINYRELCQITGYEYRTLIKYLNILEKTYICQSVRPYYSNRRKEISKNPKIYFFDTGLRNYVLQNFNSLDKRSDKGQLYENFIFTQLVKQELPPNYWRNKAQAEVDFIVRATGLEIIPIESKGITNKDSVPRSVVSFIKEHRPKSALILGDSAFPISRRDKTAVHFLPRWII